MKYKSKRGKCQAAIRYAFSVLLGMLQGDMCDQALLHDWEEHKTHGTMLVCRAPSIIHGLPSSRVVLVTDWRYSLCGYRYHESRVGVPWIGSECQRCWRKRGLLACCIQQAHSKRQDGSSIGVANKLIQNTATQSMHCHKDGGRPGRSPLRIQAFYPSVDIDRATRHLVARSARLLDPASSFRTKRRSLQLCC